MKILLETLIRTICRGEEERLFLKEPFDPYEVEIELTDTSSSFTEKYLDSFRNDLPDDKSGKEIVLQDSSESGWLAWGKTLRGARFRGWDEPEFPIDADSQPSVDIVAEVIRDKLFWRKLADHWAQEDQRNYPSANHIDFVLMLCEVYGREIFEAIAPIVEGFMQDVQVHDEATRHKTRAMWELLAGLIRGHEEWCGRDRQDFWAWFTPKLPELFNNIRHDTVKCVPGLLVGCGLFAKSNRCWDMSIEFVLVDQDPRRYKPLVDFCMETALAADFQGESAFNREPCC